MQETLEMQVRSLDPEDPLEEDMAIYSSILAWESHRQTSLEGPWGLREWDTPEQLMLSILRQVQQGGALWNWPFLIRLWIGGRKEARSLSPILMRNWLICSLISRNLIWVLSSRYLLAQAVKSFLLDLGVNIVVEDYFGFCLQKWDLN